MKKKKFRKYVEKLTKSMLSSIDYDMIHLTMNHGDFVEAIRSRFMVSELGFDITHKPRIVETLSHCHHYILVENSVYIDISIWAITKGKFEDLNANAHVGHLVAYATHNSEAKLLAFSRFIKELFDVRVGPATDSQ